MSLKVFEPTSGLDRVSVEAKKLFGPGVVVEPSNGSTGIWFRFPSEKEAEYACEKIRFAQQSGNRIVVTTLALDVPVQPISKKKMLFLNISALSSVLTVLLYVIYFIFK